MSISTLQEKFLNKGCGSALIVAAALAMGASIFTSFGRGGDANRRGPNGETENAVATVAGVPVFASAIQQAADEAAKGMGGMGANPMFQSFIQGQAVNGALQRAAVKSILGQTAPTDDEVLAAAKGTIAAQLDGAKAKLVGEGKLKPDATDAQLQAALKDALGGRTLAQFRNDLPKEILARYKDAKTRDLVLDQFGGAILATRLGEKALGSDAALRDAYKTDTVRRVFLGSASGAKDSPEARAQKALADLKAGKSFDSVMDAYSNDPVPNGKKPHESSTPVPAATLASAPEYAELRGKTAPAITGIVDVPGGKAIYQLQSVADNVPKDFEKNKAKYRAEKAREIGGAEIDRQVKAILASDAVKWNSPGYQAIAALGSTPGGSKDALALAKAALAAKDGGDRRLGAIALLSATMGDTANPQGRADRIQALEAALANGLADPTLALQLADLYGKEKKGDKATDTLIAASKANDKYDTEGQRAFGDIAGKALELQKSGVITPAQLQEVQAQQALWTAAKAEDAKMSAGAKQSDEQLKKENEAELRRQQEEAAKTAPPAKADPAPAKGGSMLPTTTGGG